MNRERKVLLIILFASILFSISFLSMTILKDRHSRILSTITVLEHKYRTLGVQKGEISSDDIDSLKDLIHGEKIRYFKDEETDPYIFGLDIKALLESKGIKVVSYKTLEIENTFAIEFSIVSSSYGFFSFWEALYEREKNYYISYFSLKNEPEGVSSTFRIGYALYE